jgi:hypothetical protein
LSKYSARSIEPVRATATQAPPVVPSKTYLDFNLTVMFYCLLCSLQFSVWKYDFIYTINTSEILVFLESSSGDKIKIGINGNCYFVQLLLHKVFYPFAFYCHE